MKELVVKDNALINASYNLDLVEQRLILLAIVEARESGRGINANDPLYVRAASYINHFGVARQTTYQALKDACRDLFARQFSFQELSPREDHQSDKPLGVTNRLHGRWWDGKSYLCACNHSIDYTTGETVHKLRTEAN